jgi:Zn-dependent M28 family amino/carboxypeptidase
VLAVLVALALNMTGNRSPGALDNASGLATLLELARTWRPRPGFEVEPLWVATGAEEIGLDGALEFLRRHEDWCRTRPTILINLDSVGAGDLISIAGTPEAMSLAREAAARLDLSCGRLRVVGAGMDHEPFARLGLCSLSLLGDVVGRSLDLHSPRDRIERVDPDAIERAGRLAAEIAWNWAERHAERPETPAAPAPVQSAS